jgi:hypothetical protein
MTYTNSADVTEHGFSVTVAAATNEAPENRHGDHATYVLSITPDDSFMADGAMTWSFSGEIERAVAVQALRVLADCLERL